MALGRIRSSRVILFLSILAITVYVLLSDNQASSVDITRPDPVVDGSHPVDRLARDAQRAHQVYQATSDGEAPVLTEVVRAYREKRGRHPPPGFDAWHALAVKSNASIDECFFDQIYEDLEPFWGEVPQKLRSFTARWPHVLSIRNNTAFMRTNDETVWMDLWRKSIMGMTFLPDVDLAISQTDEPHVMVAFKTMTKHMEEADRQKRRHIAIPIAEIRDEMVRYPNVSKEAPLEPSWTEEGLQNISSTTYWDHIMRACRPGDPIFVEHNPHRGLYAPPTYSQKYTAGTIEGFVSNFTMSKSLCHNPNLRTLHGHAIGPAHDFIYTELKPLISTAKLQGINNDIIFPDPIHMLGWGTYAIRSAYTPWSKKRNMAVWRGSAAGGRHTASTWWGFHRLRFLHMLNLTIVSYVEDRFNQLRATFYEDLPGHGTSDFDYNLQNIPFPSRTLFRLAAQTYNKLGQWTASLVDGALTDFFCAPFYQFGTPTECSYLEPHYSIGAKMGPEDIDRYKYLPDIDSHTSSAWYRTFLHSFSVPIKASLFVEWDDARLRPWLHFVPMSNEFQEWFGILEYFLGYKATAANEVNVPDHDGVGQWIGRQGAEWSRKALRTEDMQLYMYRLILEYARICADDRIYLGWVGDL